MNVTSSLIDHRGWYVPLSAAPPHGAYSEKPTWPRLMSQSTAFGIHTIFFQLPPTFNDPPSLKKVFTPKLKWFTMVAATQSQLTRWRSASLLDHCVELNGTGRPT